MNYSLCYDRLVQKALNREEIPDICERHHIIPKSMGGTNAKSNIVFFTPKEHYIAHHLLWKIYRTRSMHYAFWLMVNKCSRDGRRIYKVNSRTYSSAKEEHKIQVSKDHKGKVRSEESKQKSSISLKGKVPWNKGKTGIYTAETLEKMSNSAKSKPPDSEETRKKKSESAKNRKYREKEKFI